jgi:hypothetical protein
MNRTHESIVKKQPKAKEKFMDSLLAKRADGSLASYVTGTCKVSQ